MVLESWRIPAVTGVERADSWVPGGDVDSRDTTVECGACASAGRADEPPTPPHPTPPTHTRAHTHAHTHTCKCAARRSNNDNALIPRAGDDLTRVPFHFYRTSTDIRPTYGSVVYSWQSMLRLSSGSGPSCWAYPDMLEVIMPLSHDATASGS